MKGSKITALIFLIIALGASAFAGQEFMTQHQDEAIYPSDAVTDIQMLSDYYPGLKDSPGDTEIYIIKGKEEGGSMLVLGGTHPNEPSGVLGAVLLVEQAEVEAGTLYVIPRTNRSAFTHNDATEGSPNAYTIGDRTFRYGSRATNPVHQWPDPDVYIHASSGQKLSGSETRNLNRSYPGRPDGTLTEQVSYAITEMIKANDITVTVDFHEASPEYPVINATVSHERAMAIASTAVINMQLEGVDMGLEPSPMNLHGLTHRELGDYTNTYALLMETANPAQGRLRGATNEQLVLDGKDPLYVQAYEHGKVFVDFDENGHPIKQRVARQLTGIMEFAKALTELEPHNQLILSNVPSYDELMAEGLTAYLAPNGTEVKLASND